jgi:hypothetical protein
VKIRFDVLALAVLAAPLAVLADQDVKDYGVTLTGCANQGTRRDGYVLTHVVATAGSTVGGGANTAVLGAAGIQATGPENVYWFNDVSKLHGMDGHKVEVHGKVTKMEAGEIEVDKEPGDDDNDNEVEVESGGKQVELKTDHPVDNNATPPAGRKAETKRKVMVHRVKVESVRDLGPTCP